MRNKMFDRHGDYYSSEYRAWADAKARCNNKKHKSFKDYGARGITVSRSWGIYKNFIEDMGRKPSPKHSLDRINNNKNYTKSNCRWATNKQQARNRRSTKLSGISVSEIISRKSGGATTNELAKEFGVSRITIARIYYGKSWV